MDKIASANDGVKFLLVCVAVLSRFLKVGPMKSLTSIATKSVLVSTLNKSVASAGGTLYHPTNFGLIKAAKLKVSFPVFAMMSVFTSIAPQTKPKPNLPNARKDRSMRQLFAAWKKSACVATSTDFNTLCKQSTNE